MRLLSLSSAAKRLATFSEYILVSMSAAAHNEKHPPTHTHITPTHRTHTTPTDLEVEAGASGALECALCVLIRDTEATHSLTVLLCSLCNEGHPHLAFALEHDLQVRACESDCMRVSARVRSGAEALLQAHLLCLADDGPGLVELVARNDARRSLLVVVGALCCNLGDVSVLALLCLCGVSVLSE
jgi:hypothetical protein